MSLVSASSTLKFSCTPTDRVIPHTKKEDIMLEPTVRHHKDHSGSEPPYRAMRERRNSIAGFRFMLLYLLICLDMVRSPNNMT